MALSLSSDVHAASNAFAQFPSNGKNEETKPVVVAVDDGKIVVDRPGDCINYVTRAQWLRAAVLGANNGLVFVASLKISVGVADDDTARAMLVLGLAALVIGACSMAIGEFVSVCTQYDIQVAHAERRRDIGDGDDGEESLPSPTRAAAAAALAFTAAAALPLLSGGFVRSWAARVAVVCAASSLGMAGFGATGAYLGGANVVWSGVRVLLGWWLAVAATYGVLKLFSFEFKMQVSWA
ncbi:hypothetical protein ACP70R_027506 [Stipagrostis hirtigluma subsp. patula]